MGFMAYGAEYPSMRRHYAGSALILLFTLSFAQDLAFCHPRWPEERLYLEQEGEELDGTKPSYFNDAWNIFDWVKKSELNLFALKLAIL